MLSNMWARIFGLGYFEPVSYTLEDIFIYIMNNNFATSILQSTARLDFSQFCSSVP